MHRNEKLDINGNSRASTIKEVAKLAGVSITTVSHALSGRRPVAPETASRIRQIVPIVGYVPYSAARSLQSGKTLFIGLVVPDISNQFFAEIALGVESFAEERNYGVVLCMAPADVKSQNRNFNLLRGRAIDGLIYNVGNSTDLNQLSQMAKEYPIVLVDERVDGVDSVTSDNFQGGVLAGQHLAQLGHKNCAIFAGPAHLPSSFDRTAGFREIFPNALILEGDYTEESGYALSLQMLKSSSEVTAVFAGNDKMAFGAVAAFRANGLDIPGDLSIIGFDDIDFASRITPPLTTIRQPATEMGRIAAQTLLSMIIDNAAGSSNVLPVELLERASTSKPPTLRKGNS